jgi:hypothetical protein
MVDLASAEHYRDLYLRAFTQQPLDLAGFRRPVVLTDTGLEADLA